MGTCKDKFFVAEGKSMKYQFLYGRTSTGYCQLNQDYAVDERKDLMQLETLQNYLLVDEADLQDLPLEYYAYADKIGGKPVWIEGLTSFVPGGSSQESGSRDTSMIHKYIYSEEDYRKRINGKEEEEKRFFYRTVEAYRQGNGEDIESTGERLKLEDIRRHFGFDDEQLADFITCCLDVFPRPEKRVYCYLPSIDRDGSLSAKYLMEALLRVLPPCVNAGAGYITYSSTFHSPLTNPIPGNISVIFIPDTFENRQREISEKSKNYIFDFNNYIKQYTEEKNRYICNLIKDIQSDMTIGCRNGTQQFYKELAEFVKEDVIVDAMFLGFFWLLHILIKNSEKMLKGGEKKFISSYANAIAWVLEFEDILTEYGKQKIFEELAVLMQYCQYSEEDLEWIDNIYKSGKLCRSIIIEYLCEACLSFARQFPHNQNEKILTITNFEYTDEKLNDYILHMIFSKEKYYCVGKRLFKEMLKPLRTDSSKSDVKKRTLFFNLLDELYREYPDFVTSSCFIEEATAFLTDFLYKVDEMRDEMTAIQKATETMSKLFQRSYYPVLQELSYIVVQEFVRCGQKEQADETELEYYEELIQKFQLNQYEAEKSFGNTYVCRLEKEIRNKRFDKAFFTMNVISVLQVFEKAPFKDAVRYCKENIRKVTGFLNCYEDNAGCTSFSDWMNLFLYFYCVEDWRTMESCLSFVIKHDGLTGLIDFYHMAHQKKDSWDYNVEQKMIRRVIESHEDSWNRKELSLEERAFLAEMDVRGITGYVNRVSDQEELQHQDGYEYAQSDLMTEPPTTEGDLNPSSRSLKEEKGKKSKGFFPKRKKR